MELSTNEDLKETVNIFRSFVDKLVSFKKSDVELLNYEKDAYRSLQQMVNEYGYPF
jgi:hypothetical protein